ncbi:MAG TPA: methyltransferase domain-containing protein [Polyangiaceae bacterium]|nr:methyltransferase domain-containing protein [Polyangiaceae bacterium]
MADTRARALESGGSSVDAVRRMVVAALERHGGRAATLVDVGCGRGELLADLGARVERYVGVDVVRHDGFPADRELLTVDVDTGKVPFPDDAADVVVCAETIEHVENPRALVRELVRLARPGGWVFVTTPNQLSVASLSCLVARGEFQYFQAAPGLYPAHITALLEVDLRRILAECGLESVEVAYSGAGRVPFSTRRWPRLLAATNGLRGRSFSDNVLVAGRKPARVTPN